MITRPKLEIYLGLSGLWYWRICAANGRIIAISGEGFASKSNAQRACRAVHRISWVFSTTAEIIGR